MNESIHNSSWPASDPGTRLYYKRWQGSQPVKGIVAVVHGFGEHTGRYASLVRQLNESRYTVYGYDQRGHGRSPGPRGHIHRWETYRADLKAILELIAEREPGFRTYLYGHSMGALVTLDFLMYSTPKVAGAVISGAPLDPVGVGSAWLKFVARVLSRLVPRFPLKLGLDASALSRDASVVEAYRRDPLVHNRTTPRWGTEAMAAVARVRAHPERLKTPVLFIHGGADRLNAVAGVEVFLEQTALEDQRLILYPDTFHEPHNDLDQEQVFQDVVRWLDDH